jgi:peptidyl-prolyl cis-trans isomerase A (cyclophilin A)
MKAFFAVLILPAYITPCVADTPPPPPSPTAISPAATLPAAVPLAAASPVAAPPVTAITRVRVRTTVGNFAIELNADRAPLTVAQFLHCVSSGHYNGTVFHRVIANFVIQGGGYLTDYTLRPVTTHVVNESGNGLSNLRGTVGLARTGDPHSGDCQFYVNLLDNGALDPNPARWGYAVFGQIVGGMDVVDEIGHVATGAAGPFKEDAPLKQIVIERVDNAAAP